MSIRNLDDLFEPASVAVIGASTRPGSVGFTVWRNMRSGTFAGPLWPVNSGHAKVQGEPAFKRIADLPEAPGLAVICTPPATVPGLIAELGERGTRAAVVLTAGLTATQRQQMLEAARRYVLRILGPNCLGLLSPPVGLNASFAPDHVRAGSLAFVSQSGALATAMLDWANARGIGFSRVVSLGEGSDVDFGDMLDWLASDANTRAVLIYAESLSPVPGAARKFMSAARAAARNKPVLMVKAGRSSDGQRAAASHTGALAGSDLVIDAAIGRAGMLRVDTLQDLFVAAETLTRFRSVVRGPDADALAKITLVTNGGGAGVLAADAAAQLGLELAPLPPALIAALDAGLPANWSRGNPVDIIGDAPVERYVHTLRTLLAAPEAGKVLFMHAPTAIVPAREIAAALLPVLKEFPDRLASCWLGAGAVAEARALFIDAGVPVYDTPEQAVQALTMLVDYRRNQEQLLEAPSDAPVAAHAAASAPASDAGEGAAPPPPPSVRELVDAALAAGRTMLTEPEAKQLLAACGVPVVPTRTVAASPAAAAAAASVLGFPVVLKILAPEITHKSDVGGVVLDLGSPAEVADAATHMLERVAARRPGAHIEGFTLQPMIRRPKALELIAGTHIDPLFGPVVLFGAGGTRVEVVADRAVALPPLNEPLARALVSRTKIAKLLAGWRDVPPADAAAVHRVLIALAQLMADEPRIAELDINPLLADADGVIALDARVRVDARAPGGAARFAIRPYPAELAESYEWASAAGPRTVTLRPIRPEDEARHRDLLERTSPEDIRMRVFYSRRTIERSELARLTQIDYEREMAFVAVVPVAPGTGPGGGDEETLGVVRTVTDPDNAEAEFGILVRSDLQGANLGRRLMTKIIDYQRARGTQRISATVLRENTRMLALAKKLGFVSQAQPQEPGTMRVVLALNG